MGTGNKLKFWYDLSPHPTCPSIPNSSNHHHLPSGHFSLAMAVLARMKHWQTRQRLVGRMGSVAAGGGGDVWAVGGLRVGGVEEEAVG